jgi:hypothetical protein
MSLPSWLRHAAVACILLVALTACAGSSQGGTDLLAMTPPWGDGDEAHYVLIENEKEIGRGVLRTRVQGANVQLEQQFTGGQGQDRSLVIADARTLKPRRSERVITGANPQSAHATYHDGQVSIETGSEGSTRSRELQLPDNAYDNDSSLFLWRSLPFTEEYRTRYTSVVTLDGSRTVVVVRVLRRETVEVPAGRFEAWRVIIDAGRARHR